ncbi:hypothetical protein CC78DRAFT_163994 [Lojkania enalia]|uniref:F-box domain-containing protein n=1 Tax=Lojkania enalia TaxID=147567 RepID=A0A9P4KD84_9PLEO|nr:hypothetical protein CC78DRAFT_163994 [Didymosphaeria enalia]
MAGSSRVLTIVPCGEAPGVCVEHVAGRNKNRRTGSTSLLTKLGDSLLRQFSKARTSECYLLSLPVELVQEIASYLAPHERIAFTLACKALQSTLGTSAFSEFRALGKDEHINLLTVLHRDIPEYRVCGPCQKLHGPTNSLITMPMNKLRRGYIDPRLQVYLRAPQKGKKQQNIYLLTPEHIHKAINNQICLSTIRCSGTIYLRKVLPSLPEFYCSVFNFRIAPVVTRKNLIFHAVYEVNFAVVPCLHWSRDHVQHLLSYFDIRCCVHCSTSQMLDELICFLYHPPCIGPYSESQDNCTRKGDRYQDEGCSHHTHICDCATEYKMEAGGSQIKVYIWQWIGDRRDDYILKQKGVLRNLYEDSLMDGQYELA